MGKSVIRIGNFEIDDAEVLSASAATPQQKTLSIPCRSDPDLCRQLDGWDEHTSIPVQLDGKPLTIYKQHYDVQTDAWIMRLASEA